MSSTQKQIIKSSKNFTTTANKLYKIFASKIYLFTYKILYTQI